MKRQLGGKRGGRKRKIYPQSQLRVKLEDLSCNYQPLVTRTESSYLFILHGFWEGYEKRNCKSALFWSAYFSDLAGAEGIGLKVLREFTGNLNNFIDIMPPYNFDVVVLDSCGLQLAKISHTFPASLLFFFLLFF